MTKPDLTNTAPKRIYLDIGDQFALERVTSGSLRWDLLDGVTWSEDNATSHGIPYVRADLVPTPAASGAAPAEFEPWLRTICITAPPPQAYDLAKQAWAQGMKRGATLASREASPAPLTDERIAELWIEHGLDEDEPEGFARIIEREVRAALASPQVDPAPKPLDDPKLQQWFGDAIEGAMAFGFMGNNPPPEGHWLTRFWNIGRAEAIKTSAPAPKTDGWQERQQTIDGWTSWYAVNKPGAALSEVVCGIEYQWRPLYATPVQVAPTAAAEEPLKWRCFHCEEVFTTRDSAREHFGSSEMQSPACQIDIAEYREMEARMRSYNDEDAEIHRAMYRMQGDHATALLREEEKGYARGLEGAKKHPQELGLQPIATAAAAPVAPQDDARDAGEVERQVLRTEQASNVMPQIGPLLDELEGLDNDTLCLIRDEAPGLLKALRAINRAMEGDDLCTPAAKPTEEPGS